ncbi:hypothetical protein GCM10020331_082600 [Ectobacillus funiculus]
MDKKNKKTSVPRSAITAVDRSANPIMKLCGLVTLKLETAAGGKEADVILSYIPDHLAEEWLEEEQHSHTAYRFTGKELFFYTAHLLPQRLLPWVQSLVS